MSVYQLHRLSCTGCRAERAVKVVESANPVRHAPFLEQLLGRTFHRFTCDRCGTVDVYDRATLWTDVPARLIALVRRPSERPRWSALEVETDAMLRASLDDGGPAFVRSWANGAALRLVFGYEELREKVVAARAGLDDAAVELLKLPFTDPDAPDAPVLEAVEDSGLRLARPVPETGEDPAGADARTIAVVPWSVYEDVRTGRSDLHPGLTSGCWVHWTRAGFPMASR